MRSVISLLLVLVFLSGCSAFKPQIEYVIKGDRRLTVETDANVFSPSFTMPTREQCVFQPDQPDLESLTDVDGNTHVCKGTWVAINESPIGFENGVGDSVGKSITGIGQAALISHGLRGIGSKTNNTTNNSAAGGESNGGNNSSYSQNDLKLGIGKHR